MKKINSSEYQMIYPFGSWSCTSQPDSVKNEQFESVLYIAEHWDYDGEEIEWTSGYAVVLTFDDIKAWFDRWDQKSELAEIYGTVDESEIYGSVYDYIRDTCYNFFHPVELV